MTWFGIGILFIPVRNALDFGSSQPDASHPRRDQTPHIQSTPTPSEWPPSDADNLDAESADDGSDYVSEEENAFVHDERENSPSSSENRAASSPVVLDTTQTEALSSHPPAPTPAQRQNPNFERKPERQSTPPSSPEFHPTSSAPIIASAESNDLSRMSPAPVSHPAHVRTPESPSIIPDTSYKLQSSLPSHTPVKASEVRRRVPYPNSPPPPDPNQSGERILVPNSDTSMSASQGVSQESQVLSLSHKTNTRVDIDHRLPSPAESHSDCEDADVIAASTKVSDIAVEDDGDIPVVAEANELRDQDRHLDQDKMQELKTSVAECLQEHWLDDDDAQTDAILSGNPPPQPRFEECEVERDEDPIRLTKTRITSGSRSSCLASQSNSPIVANHATSDSKSTAAHVHQQSAELTDSPSRSHTPIDSVNPGCTSSRPGEHNPENWAAPSFLSSKTCESKDMSKVDAPRPRVSESNATTSNLRGAETSLRGQDRSRHTLIEHQDNAQPTASTSAIGVEKMSPALAQDGQVCIPRLNLSKGNKRPRDSFSRSPLDSVGDSQGLPKRRKVENSTDVESSRPSERRPAGESTQDTKGKKLKGLPVNFDSVPIDKTKGPELGWAKLHAILLRTGKFRTKEAEEAKEARWRMRKKG
jgi:hypothetical protein